MNNLVSKMVVSVAPNKTSVNTLSLTGCLHFIVKFNTNMQKIIPFFLLSIFSFTSCAQSEVVNTVNSIVVDLDQTTPAKYTIVDTIRLETRDDALIGENPRICANDNFWVVGDKEKIVVFYKNGEIKTVFNPKGRGPKEIRSLFNFSATNNYIEITDGTLNKFIRYDFNGEYIETGKLPKLVYEYIAFGNLLLADKQTDGDNALAIYDNTNSLIKDTLTVRAKGLNYAAITKFCTDGQHVYYLPSFYNEVYSINNNGDISTAYSFDFGKHWATPKEHGAHADHANPFGLWQYLKKRTKIGFLKFMKNGDWIKLNFELGDNIHNWFYNVKTKQQFIVDNSVPVLGQTSLVRDGDKFVAIYDAYNYLETFGEDGITTEDSNPIIITYKLD